MTEGRFILFEGLSGSGKTTQGERLVKYLARRGIPVLRPLNREPTAKNPFGVAVRGIIEEGKKLSRGFVERDFGTALVALQATLAADDESLRALMGRRDAAAVVRWSWRKRFSGALETILEKLLSRKRLTELERQFLFLADRLLDLREVIIPALTRGEWVVQDRFDLSNFAYGAACAAPMDHLCRWHEYVLGDEYRKPDLTVFLSVLPENAFKRLRESGKILDRYEKRMENLRGIDAAYTRAIAMAQLRSVGEAPRGLMRIVQIVDGGRPIATVERSIHRLLRMFFPDAFGKKR